MIGIRVQDLPSAGRSGAIAASLPQGERVYAIGDIHGRLDLFERLIAAVRADDAARPPARTRLVLLGDLIDRGDQSASLVELCRAASGRSENFVVLRGNHEQIMVDSLLGHPEALGLWLKVGGRATLASWGVPDTILDEGNPRRIKLAARQEIAPETLSWLGDLPLSLAVGDYLFVHAGVRPGVELDDQDPQDLLWIGDEFLDSEADLGAVVVHGHTAREGVQVAPNRIGVDTGAWQTGRLTAIGLEGVQRWTMTTEQMHDPDVASR